MTDLEKQVLDVINGVLYFKDHLTSEVVEGIQNKLRETFKQQQLSNFKHGVSEVTGSHYISFLLDDQGFYINFELRSFYMGG